MQTPAERVSVYVDGSNLYHSLKQSFGRTDIDFAKFGKKLVGLRHLVRIYYYNARVDQAKEPQRYSDQQKFFSSLQCVPYLEVRFGA